MIQNQMKFPSSPTDQDLDRLLEDCYKELMEKDRVAKVYQEIEKESKAWRGGNEKINMPLPEMSFGCSNRMEWWGKFAQEVGVSSVPHTLEWVINRMKDHPNTSSRIALDVGCGNSGSAIYLLKCGWKVISVDNSPGVIKTFTSSINKINPKWLETKQLIVVQEALERFDTLMHKVDLVVASHSLEYCNPQKIKTIWSNLYQFIKPGGYILADLPLKNLVKKAHPKMLETLQEMGQWFPENEGVVKDLLKDKDYSVVYYQTGIKEEPFNCFFVGQK